MAAGDAAAAAGLKVYSGNELANELWVRDNERGDEIAGRSPVGHTHVSADVTDATPNATPGKLVAYAPFTQPNGLATIAVGAPTTANHPVTKQYLESVGASWDGGTVAGQIFIPNAYAASASYVVGYINGDGRISRGASSRRVKKEIRAWSPDRQAVLALQLVQFRYRAIMFDTPEAAAAAAVEVGLIAEDLLELGLDWLVYFDKDGKPEGIHYERIALALLPVIQDHEARLVALEQKAGS